MEKGLNLKNSYQIASLFDMYIYMGERIAGKQDGPNLSIVPPCCTYVSTVMRSAFADMWVSLLPWILCMGPT